MSSLYIPVTVSRLLDSNDFDKVLTNATANNIEITIRQDNIIGMQGQSNVAVALYQGGTGTVAFAAAPGVTINGTPPTIAQYGTLGIMRVGANEWAYIQ